MAHFATSALSAPLPEAKDLPSIPEPPPLLTTRAGKPITTKEEWQTERVPELRQLIQHYEYGTPPTAPAEQMHRLARADENALGGTAVLREFDLWLSSGRNLSLLLITPKGVERAPVILGLSFAAYHEALDDPNVRISQAWVPQHPYDPPKSNRSSEAGRGKQADKWQIPMILKRGYAVALIYPGEAVPDDAALAAPILRNHFWSGEAIGDEKGSSGTIMAWAWTVSRVVDFLQGEPSVDPKRIALVGHSRLGKTALLAAAMDSRIALAIPVQAGCGGTAPSRVAPELAAPQKNGRPTVETVARINTSFPHWFNGRFKDFNEDPSRLPFDQHALMALVAPRPLLIAAAVDDVWANPPGQFQMARLADPVYRLLSGEGLDATTQPEPGKLVSSRLGWFIREGKHEVNETDWRAFLDFADRWLKNKPAIGN